MAGTSQKYTNDHETSVEAGTWTDVLTLERIDTNQNAYVSGIACTLGFKGDVSNPIYLHVGHNATPADDDFIQSAVVLSGGKVWMPIKRRLNDNNPKLYVHAFQGSGATRDIMQFWTTYGKMLKITTYD